MACHNGTGSVFPFNVCSPTAEKSIAARDRRHVPSSTSTASGFAAACTRAAVLTASPATMPSPVAPTVTATEPVTTPARAASPSTSAFRPSSEIASSSSKPARHRPFRVLLGRYRSSPDGHHRVADELLHDPAVATDHHPGHLEVPRQQLPDLLRVPRLAQRRETHEVAEQHRADSSLRDRPRRRHRGLGDRADGCGCARACARSIVGQRGPAFVTEALVGPHAGGTGWTRTGQGVAALGTELGRRLVLFAAVPARHGSQPNPGCPPTTRAYVRSSDARTRPGEPACRGRWREAHRGRG